FARDFNGKQPEWYETFTKIFSKANEENIAIMLVSNVPDQVNDFFNKQKNFKANVLTCDGTVMKTMLRTKNGIIAMNGAVVKGKWSEANMNDIVKFMNEKGFDQ
ncbi:MAG: hypothetical protein MUE71_08990, partial [Chitinophagaceae bacterium]|nr:hypothetical protein [Chitinophagaceae bacterium]